MWDLLKVSPSLLYVSDKGRVKQSITDIAEAARRKCYQVRPPAGSANCGLNDEKVMAITDPRLDNPVQSGDIKVVSK